ncbi:MAG: DUF5060 domain-containing protein, partial [Fidelibacterota bacterium]
MKAGLKYIFFLTLIVLSSPDSSSLQPIIGSITPNSTTISEYGKFEIDVNLIIAHYSNPFDPADMDMRAKFISPDNRVKWVWGFYDGTDWRVRFSPDMVGEWKYYVKVDDGTGVDSSSVKTFTAIESRYHGPLRVSSRDPHYLVYDDGTPFYGLGQCRPWFIFNVPDIFQKMEDHGMNFLVYWLPDWDNMLVTDKTGYDRYDMYRAENIDRVVEESENHNIYIMFTIWNHDELRGEGHPWGIRPYYDMYNPFRFLVSPADLFFTDSTAWVYQTYLYRYIIARWGYSRAIGMWQTITEIDGTNAFDNTDYWHTKINNYFKENDPFGHPTTASKSGDKFWHEGFLVMDITQMHSYSMVNNPVNNANLLAYYNSQLWKYYDKPNVIGEFGTNVKRFELDHLHYAIWVSLVTGAAITPLDWNDGGDWGDFTDDMYDQMKSLSDFIQGIAFDTLGLDLSKISVPDGFRAWAINGSDFGIFWIQDKTPGDTVSAVQVDISNLTQGKWEVMWYNTWDGTYIDTVEVSTSQSVLTLITPQFSKDIAGKFFFRTESSIKGKADKLNPDNFYLKGNFPNPFNLKTSFELSIPEKAQLRIYIYNLLGQKI